MSLAALLRRVRHGRCLLPHPRRRSRPLPPIPPDSTGTLLFHNNPKRLGLIAPPPNSPPMQLFFSIGGRHGPPRRAANSTPLSLLKGQTAKTLREKSSRHCVAKSMVSILDFANTITPLDYSPSMYGVDRRRLPLWTKPKTALLLVWHADDHAVENSTQTSPVIPCRGTSLKPSTTILLLGKNHRTNSPCPAAMESRPIQFSAIGQETIKSDPHSPLEAVHTPTHKLDNKASSLDTNLDEVGHSN